MTRRRLVALVLATLSGALPATVAAERSPSFTTPTTSTTTLPSFVTPTTPTTTTTTTTPTSPEIVTPSTTRTTTTAPVMVTPTTTTTTQPSFVTPSTTTAIDDVTAVTVATGEAGPDEPIGQIDPSGAVPDDLEITAFPGAAGAPTPAADGPTFAAGFSCAYQCIKSGVAYPRGFGALLAVETHVPARLFLTVVDENYDGVDFTYSNEMVSEFSWALDHLDPGATYYAMVAATDENGDTAYAYGQFVTLSSRTVEITVGSPTVSGGPTNIVHTAVWLKAVDLDFWRVEPPQTVVYLSLPRHVDLVLLNFREWATSQYTFCEGVSPDFIGAQGDDDGLCGTWNSATLGDVDLDAIPADRDRWTSLTIDATFNTAAGGDPLPDSYGDPRFFHFSAPVTIDVSYS